MLKIERAIFNKLGFDFEAALKKFADEKEAHPFTVDVPAPSANRFVEAAYAAGGYEVVDPGEELSPPPGPTPAAEQPTIQPDVQIVDARQRLKKLQGKTVGAQLDELRSVLSVLLDRFPG